MLKQFLKSALPPMLIDAYRLARFGRRWNCYWDGIYASFREVPRTGDGFSDVRYVDAVVEEVRRAMRSASVSGEEAYLPLLASAAAKEASEIISVLDFGGGPGIGFVHLANGLAGSRKLEYHVVELAWACDAGQRLFAGDNQILFHEAFPEIPARLDIVLAKGSLSYVEDYAGALGRLCRYQARHVFLVDIPVGRFATFASAQRNLPGVVPHWFFNKGEIVDLMAAGGYVLSFNGVLGEQYRQDNFPGSHRLEQGRASTLLFALGSQD
ncbi:MAG: methyltransferase, TIGR04325 family [Betaproteobacteria bacterium]